MPLLPASLLFAAASSAAAGIDYRVAIGTGSPLPQVAVTMIFTGDADGETIIDLPDRWAGSDRLWQALGRPRVTGATLQPGDDPAHWRLRHAPRARITIRYSVADGQPGMPEAGSHEKARPVIEPTWLAIHNQGAIAIPQGREASSATFAFGPIARGWRLVSGLTAAGPLTARQVAEGVVVGGRALRLAKRQVGGRTLRVAVVGTWPFADAALADPVARLIATETALLGAAPTDFLVTLVPLAGSATGAISYGGTGATGGFALEATDNVPREDFVRTLAHEYGHRWFGGSFGPSAEGAGPYWFTEGVNDWFAARAMVVSGLWTPADWARQLDTVLLRYGGNTARALSDADLSAQFWTNPDAMQLQYDRGFLAALLLDRRVPLHPVLRRMAHEPSGEPQDARFTRLAGAQAVAEARAAVAGPLAPDALAPCGHFDTVTRPAYDRGFDTDEARIVTRVRTAAARAAGIRPGMRYARRISFAYLDPTVSYVAEFAEGDASRTIRWLPAGDTTVTFQRLVPDAIGSAACHALIAGAAPTP